MDVVGQSTLEYIQDRIRARLTQPGVAKALCDSAALSQLAEPTGLSCDQVSALCQQALTQGSTQEASDAMVMAPISPVADATLLGDCPATVGQVDACVGELLELVAEGAPSCTEPDSEVQLDAADLLRAPNCVLIYVQCPQLASALLPALTP